MHGVDEINISLSVVRRYLMVTMPNCCTCLYYILANINEIENK